MEFVYVVERARLFDLAYPQGLVPVAQDAALAADWLARIRQHGFFVERRKAEHDSSLKQIIPYVVVRRGAEILLLQRKDTQGETRLHGKLSIGVGGHVNPEDGTEDRPGDVLRQGLARELSEELFVEGPLPLAVAGFLNDDASDVGSVHFGLVAAADATRAQVRIRETDAMEGTFVTRDRLATRCREESERFETWSRMLIERLDEVLSATLALDEALARGQTP